MQLIGLVFSILSLSYTSARSFFTQRLVYYAEPEPGILQFVLPVMVPYLFIVIPHMVAWAFILAYTGPHIVYMVLITIVLKWVAIKRLSKSVQNSKIDMELDLYKEQQWGSLFVSLISPCIVITHEIKHLLISSALTTVLQVCWLNSILLFLKFGSYDMAGGPPITHCVSLNDTEGTVCSWSDANQTLDNCGTYTWMCLGRDCPTYIRTCGHEEDPGDIFKTIVLPSVIGCLLVGTILCYSLQRMANYRVFYRLHQNFCCCGPAVTWNLLFELAEDHTSEGQAMVKDIREGLGRSNPKAMRKIADRINVQGLTPLHIACENNNVAMVDALLKMDCSVNTAHSMGITPIHHACSHRLTDIIR